MQDPGSRKLVLVVDNEPIIAQTLTLILQQHNYLAFSVQSAEEAVALCRGTGPDAVITEVILDGKMNGIELAYELSVMLPECEVLLMSGDPLTDSLLSQSPSAFDDFPLLTKPFDPQEVLDFLAVLSSLGKPHLHRRKLSLLAGDTAPIKDHR